jgi:ABC-2 type transport system ATP-binding protein
MPPASDPRPAWSRARGLLGAQAAPASIDGTAKHAPANPESPERTFRRSAPTPSSRLAQEAVTSIPQAIRTERLTKRYASTLALDELDLTVREGEVYGYLGPNGAGKTTTIRLLLGLHRPSSGRALLFGVDAWHDPVTAHHRVAYVPGEPFLWPAMTSAETFEFLARLHGRTDVAYRDVLVDRFQLDTRKKIRALSKGNRQKVQLIAALATRADLLLLDEPTSGLDPLMEMAFRDCITEAKEGGQTVLLSSHILSEVEAVCDRVGILRDGRLVDEGTLDELRHLSAQTVEVTFTGAAPELPPMAGVAVASAGRNALQFEVSGGIGPLIAALGEHPVATLTSREPSLEEIFLHHYDGSGASGASGAHGDG